MNQCIQQSFPKGFFRVVLFLDAFKPKKGRSRSITKRKIRISIIKLTEDRPAKFSVILKEGICLVAKYGNLGCMPALVRKDYSKVRIKIVMNIPKSKRDVLVFGKLRVVTGKSL